MTAAVLVWVMIGTIGTLWANTLPENSLVRQNVSVWAWTWPLMLFLVLIVIVANIGALHGVWMYVWDTRGEAIPWLDHTYPRREFALGAVTFFAWEATVTYTLTWAWGLDQSSPVDGVVIALIILGVAWPFLPVLAIAVHQFCREEKEHCDDAKQQHRRMTPTRKRKSGTRTTRGRINVNATISV